MSSVTVIGLGIMGGAIARHLAAAGRDVLGIDPSDEARAAADEHGLATAAAPAGLDGHAGPVILCLPDAASARAVAVALASLTAPRLVIETSTLGLDEKREVADTLHAAGHRVLDCPISGTGAQMARKDVVVYASGEAGALQEAEELLTLFCRQVLKLGAFGNGTRMKLIANHLVAVHNVAAAEAVLLGKRAGFDLATLQAAIGVGAGNSTMFEVRGPSIAEQRYEPAAMKLSLWAKDMALITGFARRLGAATPLLDAVSPLYAEALAEGRGDQDTAAVAEVLRAHAATPEPEEQQER